MTGDAVHRSDPVAPEEPPPSPSRRPRSPASRGLTVGLFLATAGAMGVLAANESWLLPVLDDAGAAYLTAATALAEGRPPELPVSVWSAASPVIGLENVGAGVPWIMSRVMRTGVRAHVAALWVLAGGLALAVLGASWAAGGAAGTLGGAVASGLILLSPLTLEGVTALGVEIPLAAVVAGLLGLFVYQPTWYLAHGCAAALAWALHPAGAGAVVAAAMWPLVRPFRTLGSGARSDPAGLPVAAALAPAAVLVTLGPTVPGLPRVLPLVPDAGGALRMVEGVLTWAGAGVAGAAGLALGALALAGLVAASVADSRAAPVADPSVPWYDPRVHDVLAGRARAAAGTLALALLVSAGFSGPAYESARPWLAAVLPLAVLAGVSGTRLLARGRRLGRFSFVALLAVWSGVSGRGTLGRLEALRADGAAHTAARWVSSDVIRWVDNRAPADLPLYASDPFLVLVHTGRGARDLRGASEAGEGFHERFRARPGAMILTDGAAALAETWARALDLLPVVDVEEGVVLLPRAMAPPGG